MKAFKEILVVFYLLFVTGILVSCEDSENNEYKSFLVQVDSVEISNNIITDSPFDIEFYGTIGTDGCYEFSHFETSISDNKINIKCWGKQDISSEVCPQVMVYLNGEKLIFSINESGKYMVKVKQPDNSFLEKEIIVE